MDIIEVNGYTLRNLGKINIILGKNGSGKSTMLRMLQQSLETKNEEYGKTKYITPERGGALVYDAGTEQNITNSASFLGDTRRKNQATAFRQQSVAQYKKLELLVLREIEGERREDKLYKFDLFIAKINSLLDNIDIRRHETTFKIFRKGTTNELSADAISSGESELISLGIECLVFSKECIAGKKNILFLDEPDVHLHPDLQVRLVRFLNDIVTANDFTVIIATHSTSLLGALGNFDDTSLGFIQFDQHEIVFRQISEVYKKVLPIFGAHPLSNIFNEAPILLIEGEDDERIWQQAVRSSNARLRLYPCSVDGVTNLNDFETETKVILTTVYENARGYSIRDRDGETEVIDDIPPVTRMKLSCRNAENLLLTDEVLESLGTNWSDLQRNIVTWLASNTLHPHYQTMNNFKNGEYLRKEFDIKQLRNDLMGIIGSPKPWECVVGKAIAAMLTGGTTDTGAEGKLANYLGQKTISMLTANWH